MPLIARRYLLVLWAILARPWLVLAIALTAVGLMLANLPGFRDNLSNEPVPVLASPPFVWVSESLRGLAQKSKLDTVTDFNMGAQDAPSIEGGFFLTSDGELFPRASGHTGDWRILDQLPSLKRVWLPTTTDLTAEGWQRLGKHSAIEVLSMRLSSVRGGVPEAAHAALLQLPRLRLLDVCHAGGPQDFLVPPLTALESIAIDSRRLEENLRTLADGSPRLATISLEPPGDFQFSGEMLESLRRMPNLKRLYLADIRFLQSDASTRRQLASLRAALPGVSVLPGVFSRPRVWTALFAPLLLAAVPFIFWFQATVLLGTPLGWMLPGRLAPHLFWPLAVSSVCGCLLVAVAQSLGIAATPAITLAVFFMLAITTTGTPGPEGFADRISLAAVTVVLFLAAAAVATALLAPWVVDRWLCGDMPLRTAAILLLVLGISTWQVTGYSRLPRIYARQGLVNPPGLVVGPAQGPLQKLLAGSFAAVIDQQIIRPVPAPFADMLRRPQPRTGRIRSALYYGAYFFLYGVIMRFFIVQPGEGASGWGWLTIPVSVSLSQAFPMTLFFTAGLWLSRRDSLRLEFLRPVSRREYWQGLRQAIARDLWLPAGLGAACLALVVALRGTDKLEPAIKAVALFCGWVAGTHAILLLAAVTRRPQIVATLAPILFIIAVAASLFAMGGLGPFRNDSQIEFLIAAATLAIGFTIRSAVLYRLEDREIG